MARQKKPGRTPAPKNGEAPPKPAFPLKIDYARICALADEADAEDVKEKQPSPPPQPSGAEDPFKALWEELRRLRLEATVPPPPAPPLPAPPPPSVPSAEALVQVVRNEIVAALPALIREAVNQAAPQTTMPPIPSAVEKTKTWVLEELRTLAIGLSATEPPDYLSDNRKLAERLFLEAARTGHLFGITPQDFFALLAGQIRDFVFHLANQGLSSTVVVGENTPAPVETLQTILQEVAVQSKLDFRVRGFLPTPLLALRYPYELARFGEILANLERESRTVSTYYRLRTFAGRTEDEIAAWTTRPRNEITERLGDFMKILEDDLVADDI